DGTEDHYDDDIDGDGLSNVDELAYNSDPRDANSSNRPPSDINASNLTIAENSAIGTVIGEFNATDPDGDGNFSFSLIPYPPKLWLDAADASTVIHVDGNLSRWENKVSNKHDAVLESGTVNYLPNGLEDSLPTIDTSNGALKVLDSNLSFDEWEKLTICMAFKWTNRGLWDGALWKANSSTSSTSGYSIAKMNTNNNQATGFWYGTTGSSQRLVGSIATEAILETKVLTVVCGGSLGSVKLFANGVQVSSNTNFPPRILEASEYDLKIGGNHLFSEILIYEDALNSTEREGLEKYLMRKWVSNRSSVLIDSNGTLKTNRVFDYETDDRNYTITVRATDDHNASFDKNFTITVTNVVEDLDGDETEDHYDLDIDGDGLSNADEAMLGSDPLNGSSPVVPATSFKPKNTLTVSEDAAVGTVVGQFERLVESASPIKSYEIIPHLPTSASPVLWLDASELDYAGETWQDRSLSNNHATRNGSAQGFPTILKNFQNGHSVMHYSGAPMAYHDFEEIGNVRTVFWAVARRNGSTGPLLGDVSNTHFFSNREAFWATGFAADAVLSGDTFIRGLKVDGSLTLPPQNLEIVSFRSSADLNASRFGKGGNNASFTGELGELMVFDRALGDLEMQEVERYLAHKWALPIERTLDVFSVDNNGTVRTTARLDYELGASRFILLRATNENNQSIENIHLISITDGVDDLDGDGATDSTDPDIDGDGMGNALEVSLGYNPKDAGSVNNAPEKIRSAHPFEASEDTAVGSIVGQLVATDPDFRPVLSYALISGEGDAGNASFSLLADRQLRLNAPLDYESAQSLSILVEVKDEHNEAYQQALTFTVLDVFEDLDGDGVEDHLETDIDGDGIANGSDPDRDGDGLSNTDEGLYGSDPNNPTSTNRPPTDLNSSGTLAVLENQPIGTLVGKLTPVDADGSVGYTYELVDGEGSTHNALFHMDEEGGLRTDVVFDYENNASSYLVRVRAVDPYGQGFDKSFSVSLIDDDRFSPVSINEELMLWLDAGDRGSLRVSGNLEMVGDLREDGESVGMWMDKSGYGHHAVGNGKSKYEENSLSHYFPSVRTDGDALIVQNSENSFDAWDSMTITFVYQWTSSSFWTEGIWKHSSSAGGYIRFGWSFDRMNIGASQGAALWWGYPKVSGNAARLTGALSMHADETPKIITVWYDGPSTTLKYFANGSFIKETNSTVPNFIANEEPVRIGNTYRWGELLIFRNALSEDNRELIEGYLAHKWGMEDELPSTHSFFQNPAPSGYENLEANFTKRPHTDFTLFTPSEIFENHPVGNPVGVLDVRDYDLAEKYSYRLVSGEGADSNARFYLNETGELIPTRYFDYETDNSYTVRIRVRDLAGNAVEKAIVIQVSDSLEDADGDGITDASDADDDNDGTPDDSDPDRDGDGLPNADELANGSNPDDPHSINHGPTDISSEAGLKIKEQSVVNSLVGQLIAEDEDINDFHRFEFVSGEGDAHNHLFSLSSVGELRSLQRFDYENNATQMSIRVRVTDLFNKSFERSLIIVLKQNRFPLAAEISSNLKLWLDASNPANLTNADNQPLTSDKEAFSRWYDQSGNNYDAITESQKRPNWKASLVNSKPGVDLSSSTLKIENSETDFDEWTELHVFGVFRIDTSITWKRVLGKTSNINSSADTAWHFGVRRGDHEPPLYFMRARNSGGTDYYKEDANLRTQSLHDDVGLFVMSYGDGAFANKINGTLNASVSASGSIGSLPSEPLKIGQDFSLHLAELLIFEEKLSSDNEQLVEGYLSHKWALQAKLPNDHPHRNLLNHDKKFVSFEGQADGTNLGSISEVNADYNASHLYSLSEANSSNDNQLFSMDDNGTLSNLVVFDYETNATEYKISVRASSNGALVSEKTYLVFISDADEDMDDDGFSDEQETAYGSDPNDEESIPNTAPSNISGALSVLENADAGTVVGTLTTSDTDNHESFKYNLVSRTAGANAILWLDANNTNSILEKDGKVYEWRDLSGKGNHATQSNPTAQPVRINDRVEFDGTDIMQISKDPFRGLQEPAVVVVAKWNSSVSWGNSLAGYNSMNSSTGWRVRQYDNNIAKLTFTIRNTNGIDDLAPNASTSQSNYFLASAYRKDERRILIHNGVVISNIADTGEITYSGSNRSAIGGAFYADEFSSSGALLSGSIKELIVMNGKLAEEIKKLENHLASKWGITLNRTVDFLSNESFAIDENGTVTSTGPLDYEEDTNRTIRIRATDPYGEFIEKELVVSLTNVVEDLDSDGIEDGVDEDADGDGMSNEDELTHGSDPFDVNSKNNPPTGLTTSSSLTILENQLAGSVVGSFTGTDPDNGQIQKFGLVADYPEHLSPTLWLDANASET
ncbi:MAG: hypothetical protein P8M67_06285, partial [Opitutales bacterium]|nr:hypothetical protein [Opitutales bacterium]